MEWSKTLHLISAISGVGGAIILVIYWISLSMVKWPNNIIGTDRGSFMGFTSKHLFRDAQLLLLVSVAFGIGALVHQNIEKI